MPVHFIFKSDQNHYKNNWSTIKLIVLGKFKFYFEK